ncbi:BatA domain-containing protein [Thalassoglobus sp. JC818]|uniref:BatA domain-containing protein n=1 Tax=Thalassoglobus sp. JC818 TaxID=3232136 RepID=UPI003458F968
MSSWILQHFLNPSFFWAGMALVAAPIIIHLINRLRYKRVRFAAMDFLLASQKRNQRRILIEQLLLLLLRILLILAIVALLARMILDPSQLSLFQGAKSHHVVVIDDSLSMQQRTADGTVFDTAKEVVRRLVAEGADSPQSQIFTLVRMSAPSTTLSGLSEVQLNSDLLVELTDRLDAIKCTHQAAQPDRALDVVLERLTADRSAVRHVHVISDFRELNWIESKSAIASLKALESADTNVNLVKCVEDSTENLSVTQLGGKVEVAAAGVPVTLEATIQNQGVRTASDVRADVFLDGTRTPRTIDFQDIAPGEQTSRRFDVVFETAEHHQVDLRIRDDALEPDNFRFLTVDVPQEIPVLIVDGSPGTEQALYVADALAADTSVTGFSVDVQTPDDLRRTPLENFDLIYLINVPEIAPDALIALTDYVSNGGGLVWYLGDSIRPAFYNEKLFQPEASLFPVRIEVAPRELNRDENGSTAQPDLVPAESPLFQLLTDAEVPILDLVFVNLYFPMASASTDLPNIAPDVSVLARLKNDAPVFLEHRFGRGRVVTCLTSAGPLVNPQGTVWTNWANGPASFSFAVFQLELAKHVIRQDRSLPALESGQPIEFKLNQAFYQPDVEVLSPSDQIDRIQATPPAQEEGDSNSSDPDGTLFNVIYRNTDQPGIYSFGLATQQPGREERLYAVNVPPSEGALAIAETDALKNELGLESTIQIHSVGTYDWIRNESPGSEIRWLLLLLIPLLCIAEQFLASRLSYVD